MAVVKIKTSKKYGKWLKKHLEKEHPKTKGHISYCEMCGRKTKKVQRDYRSINICAECLKKQYR